MPFDTRLLLYGWPERPGLYCDLLRCRGLYMSAACLQDSDADGDFDEGLRLDFNAHRGDLVAVTPPHDRRGEVQQGARAAAGPDRLHTRRSAGEVAGKLALRWKRAPDTASGRDLGLKWLETTATSGGEAPYAA